MEGTIRERSYESQYMFLENVLLFWKRDKFSCTIVVVVRIQSLVLDKVFLLNYLLYRLLYLNAIQKQTNELIFT